MSRRFLSYAGLFLCTLVFVSVAGADTIRWDIISLQPPNVGPGGEASARTEDGLRMTMTGSGTFRFDNPKFSFAAPGAGSLAVNSVIDPDAGLDRDRTPRDSESDVSASRFADPGKVTGGGNWTLRDQGGNVMATGTYNVVYLVRFSPAPGTPNPANNDQIGNASDAHAGLAIMEIQYDDNTRGILAVSCHLVGTPDYVFEGIVVSKTHGLFWRHEPPQGNPFVNANRTVFHVTK